MATTLTLAPSQQTAPLARATQSPSFPAIRPEFQRFGSWGPQISVARDGTIGRLARWMATNPERNASGSELWQRCIASNPSDFRHYQIVRLDQPSYFLPRGEVVFTVVTNPSQLPENPPQGVYLRHIEAMTAYPTAQFYLLQPVFTNEPSFRLYTAGDLRTEAEGDRRQALWRARHLGWAYRAADWTEQRGRELRQLARECLERVETAVIEPIVRSRFSADLQRRFEVDPVLCFELPDNPGELWFESHWFEGSDGRMYVHY